MRKLLTGGDDSSVKLHLGSLIGRSDVEVSLVANKIVSRHLAILAMTGGGKTVAARRVLRELTKIRYPTLIFDPHGDYLSFFEKRNELGGVDVKLFYPSIRVHNDDAGIITDLISKMGLKLSEAQRDFFQSVIASTTPEVGEAAVAYITGLKEACEDRARNRDHQDNGTKLNLATVNAVKRSLDFVYRALAAMDKHNGTPEAADFVRIRGTAGPAVSSVRIVRSGQISILYLAGYDHLTQSAIVSLVLNRCSRTGQLSLTRFRRS